MAGDEQQQPGRGDLGRPEVLPGGEAAQHVVAGPAELLGGQPGQVVLQLALRLPGPGRRGGAVEQRPAQALEELVVSVGHPEQQADDERGHRQGEVGDQVGGGAAGGHPVDGVVHDPLDLGAHRLDPLDQEVLGDHPAQPGVFGVVEPEEAGVGGGERAAPGGGEREAGVPRVGAEALVGQDGADLLVARHQPAEAAVRQPGRGDRPLAPGDPVRGRRVERAAAGRGGEGEGGRGGCARHEGGLLTDSGRAGCRTPGPQGFTVHVLPGSSRHVRYAPVRHACRARGLSR